MQQDLDQLKAKQEAAVEKTKVVRFKSPPLPSTAFHCPALHCGLWPAIHDSCLQMEQRLQKKRKHVKLMMEVHDMHRMRAEAEVRSREGTC